MALKSGRVGIHPSQVDPITGMLLSSPGGASDLADLDDVSIDNPELGQLLVYDGNKWENQFASISPITPVTLASLQDVRISSVSNDQILRYNSTASKWENEDMPVIPAAQVNSDWNAVSGVAQILNKPTIPDELSELLDVNISSAAEGDYLMYDSASSKWINSGSAPGPVVPEGSTVTPTDNIQTWLACAGITDKTYTTLNEVLADSTTLLALISDNNAVDYLVRSTTWASDVCANSTAMTDIGANNYCADELLSDSTWLNAICNSTYFESVLNVKVPSMTSETTPEGNVFYTATGGVAYGSAYYPFAPTSYFACGGIMTLGYQFTNPVVCKKVLVYLAGADSGQQIGVTLYIEGSNDGSDWATLDSIQSQNGSMGPYYKNISNSDAYSYYRIRWAGSNWQGQYCNCQQMQFWGR